MGQVIVIGAGPAGAVTALVLARAGIDVTVVEQGRFPRDKVCGECLSALGIRTLERLGVADELRALGAAVLRRAVVWTVDGGRFEVELPGEMWGISRRVLDEFLLTRSARAGAKVLQPWRCEGVEGRQVRARDLVSNDVRMMECERVVVADGKSVWSKSPAPPTADFGIKAHFEGVEGACDVIELFGVRGAYGGIAAVEGGKWNAAFSVPGEWLREVGGNIDELFTWVCGENAELARRMKGVRRVGEWIAAPLPRYGVRRRWAEGVVPVGNAAAAIEPIGGEGMGLAMASGEMAGAYLARELLGVGPPTAGVKELFVGYERLWRVRSVACRAAAVVVSRPLAARVLLRGLGVPGVRGVSLWMMGKMQTRRRGDKETRRFRVRSGG